MSGNEEESNVVWIDTNSGTWGTDTGSIVFVDLDKVAEIDSNNGEDVDAWSLLAYLEDSSDSEIVAYGRLNGVHVVEAPQP